MVKGTFAATLDVIVSGLNTAVVPDFEDKKLGNTPDVVKSVPVEDNSVTVEFANSSLC